MLSAYFRGRPTRHGARSHAPYTPTAAATALGLAPDCIKAPTTASSSPRDILGLALRVTHVPRDVPWDVPTRATHRSSLCISLRRCHARWRAASLAYWRGLWRGGTSPNVPAAPTAAAIISSVAPAHLIASTTLSSKVGHVMGHAPHNKTRFVETFGESGNRAALPVSL